MDISIYTIYLAVIIVYLLITVISKSPWLSSIGLIITLYIMAIILSQLPITQFVSGLTMPQTIIDSTRGDLAILPFIIVFILFAYITFRRLRI
jgi:hypothetical protein